MGDAHCVWGKSQARIRANVKDVFAHILSFDSRSNKLYNFHDTRREQGEVKGEHTKVMHRQCLIGFDIGYLPLDIICDVTWKKVSETKYMIALSPASKMGDSASVDLVSREGRRTQSGSTEDLGKKNAGKGCGPDRNTVTHAVDMDGVLQTVTIKPGVSRHTTIGNRASLFEAKNLDGSDSGSKKVVDCRQNSLYVLEYVNENETTLKYVTNISPADISLKPEKAAMSTLIKQTLADAVNGVTEYFAAAHPLLQAARDPLLGREIGNCLMYPRLTFEEEKRRKKVKLLGLLPIWYVPSRMSKRSVRVERLVKDNRCMRAVDKKYPWFKAMLKEIVKGDLAMNTPIETSLQCMTEAEAIVLGKSLIPSLKARKMAESGLKQWEMQNRAAQELFEELPFLEEVSYVWLQGLRLSLRSLHL